MPGHCPSFEPSGRQELASYPYHMPVFTGALAIPPSHSRHTMPSSGRPPSPVCHTVSVCETSRKVSSMKFFTISYFIKGHLCIIIYYSVLVNISNSQQYLLMKGDPHSCPSEDEEWIYPRFPIRKYSQRDCTLPLVHARSPTTDPNSLPSGVVGLTTGEGEG